MICILGSGLSAVAAATALVRRGFRPTILDPGLTPSREVLALKARLASTEPECWRQDDLAEIKRIGPASANGIPRKLYFGSDHTFHDVDQTAPLDLRQAALYRSFATGGFSNVWGGVIQYPSDSSLSDWPVSPTELTPHYAAIRAILCDLAEESPGDENSRVPGQAPPMRPSAQAQALYADLGAGRQELARQGIRFEFASLAVRTDDRNEAKGCRYCGLCLYGCPYDCKYTAGTTLNRLIRGGRINYVPGILADRLICGKGGIRIETRSLADGAPNIFSARTVFVACGLLETARIILASLGRYDSPLEARHSDIFTLPIVRYQASLPRSIERIHTLCQLVATIEDEALAPFPVHLQFYGYNDLYPSLLKRRAGLTAPLLAPALRALAERIWVIFGYLHSDISSSVRLTLYKKGSGSLRVEGCSNPIAGQISRRIARELLKNRRHFRALPLTLWPRLDIPGGGYHSGGIFPMREPPAPLQTDRYGRLPSLPGVQIVDASVLPAIPAGAMAFTVMANAHRIASECPVPNDD